ncbi:hypothetical protein ACGFMM_11310 [Streptomyces sp. NPDC048604]|uniref:hypothetical protein n=1 Tax=Streptomyces sp. NPDC048604 TaxID=3365578 RepID=UPI00371199C7
MSTTYRSTVAVGVAAAALVLTGCSGEGKPAAEGTKAPTAPTSPVPLSPTPTPSAPPGLEGSWAGITDGKPVGLSIGKRHAVVIAGAQICQGKLADPVTLRLSCTDATTKRTEGTIESNDGKTLVVAWKGGPKDTLKEADPGPGPSASGAVRLP